MYISRARSSCTKCSTFILSLLSPVWRAKLCRDFSFKDGRTLRLEPCDAPVIPALLALGCGQSAIVTGFSMLSLPCCSRLDGLRTAKA